MTLMGKIIANHFAQTYVKESYLPTNVEKEEKLALARAE